MNYRPTKTELTPREQEVLLLMANDLRNSDIGKLLNVSSHAIHFHINNILFKLDSHTRLGAVVVGIKRGLVDINAIP